MFVSAARLRMLFEKYPIKTFQEGAPFAIDEEDLEGVYASINPFKGFVTTNLNSSNILNEYYYKMPMTQESLPNLWTIETEFMARKQDRINQIREMEEEEERMWSGNFNDEIRCIIRDITLNGWDVTSLNPRREFPLRFSPRNQLLR
eukprot:scaffold114350_cov28-Tisochrysis_lutea.AAC.1